MSSKRKRRHEEWLKREAKRNAEKTRQDKIRDATASGDIEKMAAVFGIRLR